MNSEKHLTVKATIEYEIDITDLDPKFIDVNGFAVDCAMQCLREDLDNSILTHADFDYLIVKEAEQ